MGLGPWMGGHIGSIWGATRARVARSRGWCVRAVSRLEQRALPVAEGPLRLESLGRDDAGEGDDDARRVGGRHVPVAALDDCVAQRIVGLQVARDLRREVGRARRGVSLSAVPPLWRARALSLCSLPSLPLSSAPPSQPPPRPPHRATRPPPRRRAASYPAKSAAANAPAAARASRGGGRRRRRRRWGRSCARSPLASSP